MSKDESWRTDHASKPDELEELWELIEEVNEGDTSWTAEDDEDGDEPEHKADARRLIEKFALQSHFNRLNELNSKQREVFEERPWRERGIGCVVSWVALLWVLPIVVLLASRAFLDDQISIGFASGEFERLLFPVTIVWLGAFTPGASSPEGASTYRRVCVWILLLWFVRALYGCESGYLSVDENYGNEFWP